MTFVGIRLNLLNVLLGMFLVGPEWVMSLEMLPSASEVLLDSNSNYTVVCSGWSEVKWRLPQDSLVDAVFVDSQGSSSILTLVNVTWQNSGRFTCEEASSDQSRDIDIFIPGQGPDEWFIPLAPGVVMKETEEDTIPCKVSDPRLNVSLYELGGQTAVEGMTYEPGRGFTGRLNDTSYVCIASQGTQEKTSQTYYVFSIIVPKVMEVDLSVSSRVLKRGEVLTVNCTVKDTEMFFFTWNFPRRQEIEPLMDFLPNRIRSFVNITAATTADSGVYVCTVKETKEERTVEKNVTITVLDRGYVYLWPSGQTNVSSLLHHTVEFSVEIDAHPPPSVLWTRDNQTISTETSLITTKHLTGSRYVTTLTLVRAQMDQTGSYSANVTNEDDQDHVVFHLEVKAPPRIMSLSEVGSNTVLCVSEGTPPPTVTWYTCPSSERCSGLNFGWRNLTDALEGVTLQNNVIQTEGGMAKVQSVLTLQTLTSVSAVRCEVRNPAGGRARDLRVVSSSLLSQVSVLVVVLVLVVIAVVFFIILIIVWKKKPRYEVRWKVIESVSPDGQEYTYLDPAHLPYSSSWEVQRDHLVLGDVLGSGAFGRVVEATVSGLIHSQSKTRAAVKMVKERSSAVHSLVSELKVLVHLGPHLNVVNLLGACTRGGPVYLITEFCRHGDLVNYLQKNKHTFPQGTDQNRSDGDGGYMDMNKEDSVQYEAMKELNYAEIEPAVYETAEVPQDHQEAPEVLLSESPLLSLNDLLSFSYQVCQAMDFLSSKQCVHRDLAARNVLVCDGKLVKVGDFGLARDMLRDQDYVARGNSFLPLKWMSPESIFQNVYSSQSDVWSFGVLLWEIFSLGCSPYSDLPMTQQFCSALKRGYRMERPQHSPTDMYDLMKRCWESSPQSRPSFSSLVISVGDMLSDDFRQRYVKLTEEFMKGENPAVFRSRQCSSRTEDHTHEAPPVSVDIEAESVELSPAHGSYVIPSTDITIETSGEAALDVASPLISDSSEDDPAAPPQGEDESSL